MSKEKMVRVIDSSVTSEEPKRIHDLLINGNIKQITFEIGKDTILPISEGIKFMKDGFQVVEVGSDKAIMTPASTDETIRMRISEDEVVAKYNELTLSALKVRAAVLQGGEKFLGVKSEKNKPKLIDFIKSGTIDSTIDEEENLIDDSDDEDDTPVVETKPDVTPEVAPVVEEVTETETETESKEYDGHTNVEETPEVAPIVEETKAPAGLPPLPDTEETKAEPKKTAKKATAKKATAKK